MDFKSVFYIPFNIRITRQRTQREHNLLLSCFVKDIHSQKCASAELKIISHIALVGSVCCLVGMIDLILIFL